MTFRPALALLVALAAFASTAQAGFEVVPDGAPQAQAQQPQGGAPAGALMVNPAAIKAVCAQAVVDQQDSSDPPRSKVITDIPTKVEVLAVNAHPISAQTYGCDVDTKLVQLLAQGREPRESRARFAVSVDLATAKATVSRIDAEGAKQVAVAALADALIVASPNTLSEDDIVFNATVGGRKCAVEVAKRQPLQSSDHWVVKKLSCKP